MSKNFLTIESCGEKIGIDPDSIAAWKLDKHKLTLHMITGHTYTYHVSIVKNFILFLEDNSLLLDKFEPTKEKE